MTSLFITIVRGSARSGYNSKNLNFDVKFHHEKNNNGSVGSLINGLNPGSATWRENTGLFPSRALKLCLKLKVFGPRQPENVRLY